MEKEERGRLFTSQGSSNKTICQRGRPAAWHFDYRTKYTRIPTDGRDRGKGEEEGVVEVPLGAVGVVGPVAPGAQEVLVQPGEDLVEAERLLSVQASCRTNVVLVR